MPLDRVRFFNAGYCLQWGYLSGGATWSLPRFHAVFAYLEHPRFGAALIDTGYAKEFFDATERLPGRLYRWLTPARLDRHRDAAGVLAAHDLAPVERVFVSHFHGDHIAGLRRFPQAAFVYRRESYQSLLRQRPWAQLRHAFLPDLLPEDFVERGEPIEESAFVPGVGGLREFRTFDYWGDGSLVLVDLPGHAEGHTGYILTTARERLFYVVDATWRVDVLLEGRTLPRLSRDAQHDYADYAETQAKLRRLAQAGGPTLVACHCPRTQALIGREK